jgi:hypothetical protein
VIQPRKDKSCESLCIYNCRGSTGLLNAPGGIGLAGVLERGRCEGGSSRNLGELAVSMPEETGRGNRWNNLRACFSEAFEEEWEVREHDTKKQSAGSKWYCQAKGTKCGEKGSEQS